MSRPAGGWRVEAGRPGRPPPAICACSDIAALQRRHPPVPPSFPVCPLTTNRFFHPRWPGGDLGDRETHQERRSDALPPSRRRCGLRVPPVDTAACAADARGGAHYRSAPHDAWGRDARRRHACRLLAGVLAARGEADLEKTQEEYLTSKTLRLNLDSEFDGGDMAPVPSATARTSRTSTTP